ncbi:uncharacterized protein [Heptranchias perlo]|uniref:uncharacterized protein n=1 Tax=Heptranchias perlo TaxID=212740 RepID=UPI003559BBB4
MSSETINRGSPEDFWDLPDDLYINLTRNMHEAESEEQDGSADPPEVTDGTLPDTSVKDCFPLPMDACSKIRPDEWPEGTELSVTDSFSECFPFQMDKNDTIRCGSIKGEDISSGSFIFLMNSNKINRSSEPLEEVKLVKDNCAHLTCHCNANKTVRLWKKFETLIYYFVKPVAGLSSGEGTSPVEEADTQDGGVRYQHNFKSYRLQLFNAIFEGHLETIDALMQKIEESNGCLSHQKLKDPNTGQTCLMKALLKITNKKEELVQDCRTVEIVKKLISFSKKSGDLEAFVNAAYTDKIYRGQTALHIAVERRRCDLVELLVRNGAAVDVLAKGSFFRNRKHKQYSFYFGGYPLSLAACTNQVDVVTFLIDHGADPRAQDRAGNTVLHALVSIAYDTPETRSFTTEMYDLILVKSTDMEPSGNLEKITNREGLTPLRLAAHTGKIEIFKHILGREIKQNRYKHLSRKFTEWEYGPVSCSLYDLSGVDTIEENSVLQTVVSSSRNRNRHEMLCVEPMNELLQKKWEDFGGYMFLASFLFYLTYIITLTIVASHRPQRRESPVSLSSYPHWHFQAQSYILLAAVYFMIKEAAEMVYLRRSNLHSVLVDGSFHILYFLQSVLVIVFNSLSWSDVEGCRVLLVLALALGWFNVLYYTRGFKLTGIYCVMIKKIILQDILRFLLVYVVFIVGFAAALASLIEECPPGSNCPFDGFSTTILELFKLTIGLGDLGIQKYSRFPVFFLVLLVLYVILTFVLLLNMLIALMGETVTKISSESEKIWKLQRAVTTLHFERSLPKWLRMKCRNCHSFTEVTVGLTPEGTEDRRWCLRTMDDNIIHQLQDDLDGNTKTNQRLKDLLGTQFFCCIADGNMEEFDKILRIFQVTKMKLTEPWLLDFKTGKTCLMKALLNLNDNTEEIIEKLIAIAEKNECLKGLIDSKYIDKDYRGQTALHIAIERRCPDIVRLLLQKGADVNAKAKGNFFKPSRTGHGFYFGELPLALAACTNQPDIVVLLMEDQRTKVGEQDSEGNTVLHALVTIADDTVDNTNFVTEMYNKILVENKDNNLEEIKNVNGLTSLQLAAKLGKFEIFRHILGREMKGRQYKNFSRKITDWAYGPVSSSLYDITGVDTIEKNSVLKIIVFNTKIQNRHKLLSVEPLNTMLKQKWNKFGRYMFAVSCLLYVSYVAAFTAVYYDRSDVNKSPFEMNVTTVTSWPFAGRIFILLWAGILIIMEIVMITQLRLSDLQSVMTDAWFHILFLLQAALVVCSAILYWVEAELHLAALVGALALGWIDILYYTRGFQSMGIYSVMLQKILLTDVVHFLFVYLLFLIGFAAALASLIQGCSNEQQCSPFDTFSTAVLELFKLTIGLGDLEIQSQARYPRLFLFLLVTYVVLTFILLLNMLIALMGETVGDLSKESKTIWKLQRARTILNLEQSLPKCLKEKFQLGSELKGKRYIRINEVNWTKWNTRVARIHEDPGKEEQEESVDKNSDETDSGSLPSRKTKHRNAGRIWGKRKHNLGTSRKHKETAKNKGRQTNLESEMVVLELNRTVLETSDYKEADKDTPSEDSMV